MKLGLLADIHEHLDHLMIALRCFETQGVDLVIVLGDVLETGRRIEDACRLLSAAGAIGVWGNHDYGLCANPSQELRAKYGEIALKFLTSLQPQLELEDCYFSHIEPWLDPNDLRDLWYFEGPPDAQHKLERIFNSRPNRVLFAGHYHNWLLATPDGMETWNGQRSVWLSAENRFFVVIGALCAGRFAVFDTDSTELTPFNVD